MQALDIQWEMKILKNMGVETGLKKVEDGVWESTIKAGYFFKRVFDANKNTDTLTVNGSIVTPEKYSFLLNRFIEKNSPVVSEELIMQDELRANGIPV